MIAAKRPPQPTGFSLVEVLVVVAIIGIIAAILLPALAKSRERGLAIACLHNTRQLVLATQIYGDDHNGELPYNLIMGGTPLTSYRTDYNWVNNVMTWDLSSDNTNTETITRSALGQYVNGSPATYRCPSDRLLSSVQQQAGWEYRIRSYSMNALMGNPGSALTNSSNINDPNYRQFLKLNQITRPSEMFVFLDEHSDSIDDGCFVNRQSVITYTGGGGYTPSASTMAWTDLPASYHNRSASFSFADGHASLHRWQSASTTLNTTGTGFNQPMAVSTDATDYQWVMEHMSIQNY